MGNFVHKYEMTIASRKVSNLHSSMETISYQGVGSFTRLLDTKER